jgi:hypothetical protein
VTKLIRTAYCVIILKRSGGGGGTNKRGFDSRIVLAHNLPHDGFIKFNPFVKQEGLINIFPPTLAPAVQKEPHFGHVCYITCLGMTCYRCVNLLHTLFMPKRSLIHSLDGRLASLRQC